MSNNCCFAKNVCVYTFFVAVFLFTSPAFAQPKVTFHIDQQVDSEGSLTYDVGSYYQAPNFNGVVSYFAPGEFPSTSFGGYANNLSETQLLDYVLGEWTVEFFDFESSSTETYNFDVENIQADDLVRASGFEIKNPAPDGVVQSGKPFDLELNLGKLLPGITPLFSGSMRRSGFDGNLERISHGSLLSENQILKATLDAGVERDSFELSYAYRFNLLELANISTLQKTYDNSFLNGTLEFDFEYSVSTPTTSITVLIPEPTSGIVMLALISLLFLITRYRNGTNLS